MRSTESLLLEVAAALPDSTLRDEVIEALRRMDQQIALAKKLRLSPKENRLLMALLDYEVATNEMLITAIGVKNVECLNVHKHRLQRKLDKINFGQIVNRRGWGYELIVNRNGGHDA